MTLSSLFQKPAQSAFLSTLGTHTITSSPAILISAKLTISGGNEGYIANIKDLTSGNIVSCLFTSISDDYTPSVGIDCNGGIQAVITATAGTAPKLIVNYILK